jgi:hypothetical protein
MGDNRNMVTIMVTEARTAARRNWEVLLETIKNEEDKRAAIMITSM